MSAVKCRLAADAAGGSVTLVQIHHGFPWQKAQGLAMMVSINCSLNQRAEVLA